MDVEKDFILVKYADCFVDLAFYVSIYPVTRADYVRVVQGHTPGPAEDNVLYRTDWLSAVRFCNRLSARHGLPQSYIDETGQLVDPNLNPTKEFASAAGFRLPGTREWEYAAHGWSQRRTGSYFPIQKQYFKVPYQDYPTTEQQREWFEHGYSRKDDLLPNPLGIYGMLAYGREWITDFGGDGEPRGGICFWQEYFTNYDNDIGYQVTNRTCGDTDEHAFRVVISQKDFRHSSL